MRSAGSIDSSTPIVVDSEQPDKRLRSEWQSADSQLFWRIDLLSARRMHRPRLMLHGLLRSIWLHSKGAARSAEYWKGVRYEEESPTSPCVGGRAGGRLAVPLRPCGGAELSRSAALGGCPGTLSRRIRELSARAGPLHRG